MAVEIWGVGQLWHAATLAAIEKALSGEPKDDERRKRLGEFSDWAKSTPPGVRLAVRSGIENAAQAGTITEEEGSQLLSGLGEG
jgi:hypothetical protein